MPFLTLCLYKHDGILICIGCDPGANLVHSVEATGVEPGRATADIFLLLLQSHSTPNSADIINILFCSMSCLSAKVMMSNDEVEL